ncbi:MAG: alpha/beta fold hydrolase [Pirellulaceae bacterium]|nr:alpha/beta fold hydrolase [Pirellulaceae bacterium]
MRPPALCLLLPLMAFCWAAGCRSLGTGPHSGWLTPRDEADRLCQEAAALEKAGSDRCVDWYFAATRLRWQSLAALPPGLCDGGDWRAYNTALADLLQSAWRCRRLDATRGLLIRDGPRQATIPVVQHGFPWNNCDFQRLLPPPRGHNSLLRRYYDCPGAGLPFVVLRARDPHSPAEVRFLPEQSSFAATALLRFDDHLATDEGAGAVLEFYNPLTVRKLRLDCGETPLAADLTAPLAEALADNPRTYFAGFLQPGGGRDAPRLQFLEPYQPGKIPVVLVHGLFSDPQAWADMTNDLRADPAFADRFQIWMFRYPTGQGFLQSAARLREELAAASELLDPAAADPALRQMVLIGHSMGGLIAKLQITHSEERIWSQVANRPLEAIVTTEQTRLFLAKTAYFDPAPQVRRVIFIATPHAGSLPSSAVFGEGVSHLVKPSPEQAAMHRQLIDDNPGVFNPLIERRFPTSIDLLTPGSPLLEVMRQLRINPCVQLHNIVGVVRPLSLDGPSDGVVSAASAEHPGCQSALAIGAKHAEVHRAPQASVEVLRILNEHWQVAGCGG